MVQSMPRILLIDDDAMIRHLVTAVLVRAGYEVVQAENGRLGANLFRAAPTDLVISDLIMPDHEGLELIAALRREWPALPIIAMTGIASRSSLYLGMAAKLGACRTLTKPFAPKLLLSAVEELLGSI